jgi:hypothetical protein
MATRKKVIKIVPNTCDTCRFYHHKPKESAGECKRYAPRALVDEEGNATYYFPVVPEYEECGDHKPAEWNIN